MEEKKRDGGREGRKARKRGEGESEEQREGGVEGGRAGPGSHMSISCVSSVSILKLGAALITSTWWFLANLLTQVNSRSKLQRADSNMILARSLKPLSLPGC